MDASNPSIDEIQAALDRHDISTSSVDSDQWVGSRPSPRVLKDRFRTLQWVVKWAVAKGMDEYDMSESDALVTAWKKAAEVADSTPGSVDMGELLSGGGQAAISTFEDTETETETVEEDAGPDPQGLDRFQVGISDRRTGRVEKTGGLFSTDVTAVRSDDGELPSHVKNRVERVATDALAGLVEFVPKGTRIAQFTFNVDTDEITNMSVSYNPAADPPAQIGDFSWRGKTTPRFLRPEEQQLEIAQRYSYAGPPQTDIRTQFAPFPEGRDPLDIPPGHHAVQGPVDGTLKPYAGSPVIMLPNGQVVGIDQEAAGGGDMLLWVEIVQYEETGDWTVMLDLRPESDEESLPLVGVDAAIAGGIPHTRDGAFHAAFTIMSGESPSGIFTEIIEEIESSPEVAAAPDGGKKAEEDLRELLGDLEPQVEEQTSLASNEETRPERRRSRRTAESKEVEPGQAQFGAGGNIEKQQRLGGESSEDDRDHFRDIEDRHERDVEEIGLGEGELPRREESESDRVPREAQDSFAVTNVEGTPVFEAYVGDTIQVEYDISGPSRGTDTIEGVIEDITTYSTSNRKEDERTELTLSTGWEVTVPEGAVRKDGRRRGRLRSIDDVHVLYEG